MRQITILKVFAKPFFHQTRTLTFDIPDIFKFCIFSGCRWKVLGVRRGSTWLWNLWRGACVLLFLQHSWCLLDPDLDQDGFWSICLSNKINFRKDIFYSRSIYSINAPDDKEGKKVGGTIYVQVQLLSVADSRLETKHKLHLHAPRAALKQAKLCQHSQVHCMHYDSLFPPVDCIFKLFYRYNVLLVRGSLVNSALGLPVGSSAGSRRWPFFKVESVCWQKFQFLQKMESDVTFQETECS